MGELFRRFWLPAMLPSELPKPDCPPVRLRLLGEDLVAYRDSNGEIGVVEGEPRERLARRGVADRLLKNSASRLLCDIPCVT
jgi:phenylpropionate dioxygenase-like ring-hydroxylating dioxygenase large terminal subunit